jgi:hypothetical protein
MLRYQSRRHRRLMDESERALSEEAAYGHRRESRIANDILADGRNHRLWESRHAELLVPVAEQGRRAPQIFALRDLQVRLLHRRALIGHIRSNQLVGNERDKLFTAFYGPLDMTNAILTEHRQYTLAVSSGISTDHLVDVMDDTVSTNLLREYEQIYTRYFSLYCCMVNCADVETAEALKPMLMDLRQRAFKMIKRIHSERPEGQRSDFDRQAMLAQCGRYPMRNYMVG